MKLATLNIWGGRISEKIEDFFKRYPEVDIWCFQEVFKHSNEGVVKQMANVHGYEPNMNLFSDLESYLPHMRGEFCPTFGDTNGMAIFLRSDISVLDRGELTVAFGDWGEGAHPEVNDHDRKLQWLKVLIDGKTLFVANVHLTHRPLGKGDSEKRLKQSEKIIDVLRTSDAPRILAGDFNLLPDTESIRMIEREGMRNLIKEYGIVSTRTELYRRYNDGPRFADYIFVSPEIEVKDFQVLPDAVSDHSPVVLDFDL